MVAMPLQPSQAALFTWLPPASAANHLARTIMVAVPWHPVGTSADLNCRTLTLPPGHLNGAGQLQNITPSYLHMNSAGGIPLPMLRKSLEPSSMHRSI